MQFHHRQKTGFFFDYVEHLPGKEVEDMVKRNCHYHFSFTLQL